MDESEPTTSATDVPQEILDRVAELERLRAQFLDASNAQLRSWIWEETDSVIEADPTRTLELGRRGLRSLRRRVKRLERRMPRMVRRQLGDKNLWVIRPRRRSFYNPLQASTTMWRVAETSSEGMPRFLANRLKRIMSRLGRIHRSRRVNLGKSHWSKNRRDSGLLDFWRPIPVSEDMREAFESYLRVAVELDDLLIQRRTAASERVKEEADALWRASSEAVPAASPEPVRKSPPDSDDGSRPTAGSGEEP